MLKIDFSDQCVNLIMECVTTVAYQIKVNGELSDGFKPERGIRQGDPWSLYLFLICAEGFSALLKQAEQKGRITGVKVCHNALVFHTFCLPMTL
jgi:hypothetical protein